MAKTTRDRSPKNLSQDGEPTLPMDTSPLLENGGVSMNDGASYAGMQSEPAPAPAEGGIAAWLGFSSAPAPAPAPAPAVATLPSEEPQPSEGADASPEPDDEIVGPPAGFGPAVV